LKNLIKISLNKTKLALEKLAKTIKKKLYIF